MKAAQLRAQTMQDSHALVIGSSSGLGSALASLLVESGDYKEVHTVSTKSLTKLGKYHVHHELPHQDEITICNTIEGLPKASFTLIICCVGHLHSNQMMPEKKLEELNVEQLQYYFRINTILPSLWLAGCLPLIPKKCPSHMVFFSARVGSIQDNKLGGWYGYRSSKAALNMMLKSAQVELKRRFPLCSLVAYHPGTVDTKLSKPFQQNVPSGKLFTPEFSVNQLLSHLAKCGTENSPHYIDWEGKAIPW